MSGSDAQPTFSVAWDGVGAGVGAVLAVELGATDELGPALATADGLGVEA